jgi:predicted lipoprotein with Yx(FWY)xxD motif
MRRTRTVLALGALALLALAGCGDDDDDDAVSTATTEDAPAEEAADVQVGETSLGDVLVDADGMTLYLFTRDTDGASACSGGCAEAWPPLTVEGEPTAGEGVDGADLGTIERDDGSMQVTYHGKPLYLYAADAEAGDVTGHEVGGVWFAVTPAGEQAEKAAAPAAGGGY